MSRFLIVVVLLGLGAIIGFFLYPVLNKRKDRQD